MNNLEMEMGKYELFMVILIVSGYGFVDGLRMDYYFMMNCPFADGIVKNIVNRHLQADPTLAAALVRMHFHDCFVQGCDASVLIDSTKDNTAEKDSPANLSLRGYEIIDEVKQQLEIQCPGVVSCADILAMAARDAVFFAGGPVYEIPKGRKDGTRSRIEDTINLPPPTLNSSELIRLFGQRGFTAQEMVALSGAHTLGVARCSSFKHRLSNFDSTHDVDPTLDAQFAKTLSKRCTSDKSEQAFDTTKDTFDNDYYNALQRNTGVLFSDQTLYNNPRTRGIVNRGGPTKVQVGSYEPTSLKNNTVYICIFYQFLKFYMYILTFEPTNISVTLGQVVKRVQFSQPTRAQIPVATF